MKIHTLALGAGIGFALALGGPALAQSQTTTTPPAASNGATSNGAAPNSASGNAAGSGSAATAAPTPAPGAAAGSAPAPAAPPAPVVKATNGDWETRCIDTGSAGQACQLYQLIKDQKQNSVAEISIFPLPSGQKATAGATIITPLETLLTRDVTLQIDSAPAKVYPFTFCTTRGCVARVGFSDNEVAAMKKGHEIKMQITPAAAPDKPVDLTISLKGFTAGYDDLLKSQKAAAPANKTQPAKK